MTEPADAPARVPVCYRHPGKETYIVCQRCGRPICTDCMHPASVGFQCPECVREGARSTRAGRTAYGGRRPGDPTLTSKILVGVNALVWLLIVTTGATTSEWLYRLALIPDRACVAVNQFNQCVAVQDGVAQGSYWQLVTSMFTHVEIWHIGFNMLALWILGPQLELVLGRWRFLALYLLSGLAGSTLVYLAESPFSPTLGASGAIFGLMGALLVIAFKVHGNVTALLGWIAVNFVITFTVPNISWQGHLGGFVGGALLAVVLVYAPKRHRTLWQVLGLSLFTLALAVLIAVRTAVLV
jgi:membrane associated rhomboid family serine protease